jgi:hypothetical protein
MCGAKNRRGLPCRRAPMLNGRCSNHGGKSLKGFAHPNFKHGCYSHYDPLGIWIWYQIQIRALKRRLERYEPKRGTRKAVAQWVGKAEEYHVITIAKSETVHTCARST